MTDQMNVPKLRFGCFSDTWEQKSIAEVATKVTDGTHDTPKPVESGVPYITAIHVKDGSIDFDNCYYVTPEVHQVIYKRCNPEKGDLLLVNIGAGTATCAINTYDAEFSMKNVALIKPDREIIDPYFLEQIQRKSTARLFHRLTSGGAQPFFSLKEIKKLIHYYPNLPEQQKIASFLSKVDEKVALLTEKKDKLTEYKKGVMQQLFNGKWEEKDGQLAFTPPTLRFKADDGSEFPDWENTKLGDVNSITGGGTPSTADESLWGGNIQWFTPTELKTKYVSVSKRTITDKGLSNSSAKILPKGTVLFSSRATVGDVSIAQQECTTNQGFQSFNGKPKKANNEFTYYWISSHKNEFLRRASGSTFLEISKSEIAKVSIYLPSFDEQLKIANFLSAIDQKIALAKSELDKAKEWKRGLLQQMFV